MKLDKNYKMSKPTKTLLNSIHDESDRATMKTLLCEAENHSVLSRKKMQVKVVEQEKDTDE